MSKRNAIAFFKAVSSDSYLQEKFKLRNLEELLFHAKNIGYDFTREELAEVLGQMQARIMENMGEEFSGHSTLWRPMWGKYYFMWAIEDVFGGCSEEELEKIASS